VLLTRIAASLSPKNCYIIILIASIQPLRSPFRFKHYMLPIAWAYRASSQFNCLFVVFLQWCFFTVVLLH